MQNYKKNFVTRTLAWVLAAVMVIAMVPMGVLAETFKVDGEIETADWTISEKEAKTNYWPLTAKNQLVKVSRLAEPIKFPTIEYAGAYNTIVKVPKVENGTTTYVDEERQVIRITFNTHAAASSVWQRLLLKFDPTLYGMIDWDNSGTGAYVDPRSNLGDTNRDNYKNTTPVTFTQEAVDKVGSSYVCSVLLNSVKYKKNAIKAPMHFVLKKDANIANLDSDKLVQSRIVDNNYVRVYRYGSSQDNGYTSYTSNTIVPKYDYKAESIPQPNDEIDVYTLGMTTDMLYNKEKGYVDVQIKHLNRVDAGKYYDENLSLRLVMDQRFFNTLKNQEDIGQVFLIDSKDKPYGGEYLNPGNTKTTAIKRENINTINSEGSTLSYIQILGNTYTKTQYENGKRIITAAGRTRDMVINGAINHSDGFGTVVRFYVDQDKYEELAKNKDVGNMSLYTSFLIQNKDGRQVFSGTVDKDRFLKAGSELVLDPGAKIGGAFSKNGYVVVEVGESPHSIVFNSRGNSLLNTPVYYKSDSDFWWRIPFDMELKKGTPIKIYMNNGRVQVDKFKIYSSKAESERGIDGDHFTLDQKSISYEPKRMLYGSNLIGGAVAVTQDEPNIQEIFDTEKQIYGHTSQGHSIVRVTGNTTKGLKTQAFLSKEPNKYDDDGNVTTMNSEYISVNRNADDGYLFTDSKVIDPIHPFEEKAITKVNYELLKDAPIGFTSEDFAINALETPIPVIEQVQSKVTFDLNGGHLGDDTTAIQDIIKIAPLNENYKYTLDKKGYPTENKNDAYKANGFEGDNIRTIEGVIASHDGQKLEDKSYENIIKEIIDNELIGVQEAEKAALKAKLESGFEAYKEKYLTSRNIDVKKSPLALRQFPGKESEAFKTPEIKKGDDYFLGWSTKKLTTKEEVQNFLKAETLNKVEDWANVDDNSKVYKFTETSPIDKLRTVYAVYGTGFTIKLHRNSAEGDTVVEDILVTKEMFEQNSGKIKLPIAYDNNNNQLPEFKVNKKTFVGWKYSAGELEYKEYYPEINYNVAVADDDGKHIKDITYKEMKDKKTEGQNGISLERILDGTTIDFSAYQLDDKTGFAALNGETINLYGLYTPYLKLKAEKKFFDTDGTTTIDAKTAPTVRVGLLYRTAVTPYEKPTIANEAAYFAPEGAKAHDEKVYQGKDLSVDGVPKDAYLKVYSKLSKSQDTDLEWEVKGFDENGDRRSFILVELGNIIGKTTNNADEYYNFNQKWSSLGIKPELNKYSPSKSGKTQVFETQGKDTPSVVDVFSAATVRTPAHADPKDTRKSPVIAYNYVLTNTKIDKLDPVIDEIYSGDKSFKLINTVRDTIQYFDVDINGTVYHFERRGEKHWEQKTDESKKFDTNYNTKDGSLTLTYSDGTSFVNGDIVKVQYNYSAESSNDNKSNWAKKIVKDKPVSGKVTDIKQEPNIKSNSTDPNAPYDTVVITGTRPSHATELPANETEYVLADGNGDPIMIDGKEVVVPFDKNSATVKFEVPKAKVDENTEYKIISREPNKVPVVSDDSTKLDLTAPTVVSQKAEDGGYGMFIDITATISTKDAAADDGVKIMVDDKEYIVAPSQLKTNESGDLVSFINSVPRPQDSNTKKPTIKIIVKDNLNNEQPYDVDYTYVDKTPTFSMNQPRAGRDYLEFTELIADKIVYQIKRRNDGVIASGEAAVVNNTNFSGGGMFIDLVDKKTSEPVELQKGDMVIIEAVKGDVTAPTRTFRVR